MSSQFQYSRPCGIPGSYEVHVVLDLGEKESGSVSVTRHRIDNCGRCGKQAPELLYIIGGKTYSTGDLFAPGIYAPRKPVKNPDRRVEHYTISQIAVQDEISIEIQNTDVVPHQRTQHVATPHGFTHLALPYAVVNYTWDVVPLNLIYLFDLDVSDKPLGVLGERSEPILFSQVVQQGGVTVHEVTSSPKQLPARKSPGGRG
jgi:hypothetical protein